MEMFETEPTAGQKTYTSLAAKYRPQTFEEVVGQESVSKTLVNALKTGRTAHSYLFYGPRGCGKTTSARLLAKALNCTGGPENKPTAKPCGKCPQCLEIAAGNDMDVLELDAASNTQVERVREAIIDTVALASGRDRYKIFILDEVHMLSTSSFNALLKTIEEPPSHVVFILATTELHKVPLTISSRCQTFRFKPITESEIRAHLIDLAGAEGLELEEEAAKIIAKAAGGALRDALTIFDRAIAFCEGKINKALVSEMLGLMPQDLVKNAACAVVKNDGLALHRVFETLKEEGFDALSLLKDLKNAFGEIFYLAMGAGAEPFEDAKEIVKEASTGFIAGLTRKLAKLEGEVKFSDTPLLAAEVGLFTIMESALDIESLVARLETLESGTTAVKSGPPAGNGNTTDGEKKSLAEGDAVVPFNEKPRKTYAEAKQPDKEPKEAVGNLSVQKITDNAAAWGSFKTAMAKSYPFLYDIMQEVKPRFAAQNKWVLVFKSGDEYFKDTVKKRVKDLQTVAAKITGSNIDFDFTAEERERAGFAAPVVKAEVKPSMQPRAAVAAVSGPISDEEPFVSGDFSAFAESAQNAAPQAAEKAAGEIGEMTKKILNIFDGYITEPV
jgi:DNA polymerase-3 subunit gamma/tau